MALPKWLPGWAVGLVAALLAVFTLGRRSARQAPPATGAATINRSQEVSNEQAAAVEAAGRELAASLGASPSVKRAGVLKWARARGAGKRCGLGTRKGSREALRLMRKWTAL